MSPLLEDDMGPKDFLATFQFIQAFDFTFFSKLILAVFDRFKDQISIKIRRKIRLPN